MDHHTEPHYSSSALITIDVQNDFTLNNAPAKIEGSLEILPNIVKLLECYRQYKLPIIHVIRLYHADGSNVDRCRRKMIQDGLKIAAPDSVGSELVQELKPDLSVKLNAELLLNGAFQKIGPEEYIMYKPRWGAFYQTGLEERLHKNGIDTLVFCGCNFPNCPRTSIYEASERDFRVVLISDAMSQLYPKGELEIEAIGVQVKTMDDFTKDLKTALG